MLLSCLLVIPLLLPTTMGQGSNRQLCEEGWTFFTDNFESAACFRAVRTPLPWQQAQEYCQQDIAILVNLDPISQFSYFESFTESLVSLGEFLFDELGGEFWSGMHVRDGRLMWDARGPEYVIETFTKSWQWENDQPSTNVTEDSCGHVILGRRTLTQPTTQPPLDGSGSEGLPTTNAPESTTVVEVFNGETSMRLSACRTSLPFVCKKPVVIKNVGITSFCPNEWFGNQDLPYCFRILKDPLPSTEAGDACGRLFGGEFYKAQPYTYNFTMAISVLQYYLQTDSDFIDRPVPSVWVDGGPVENDGIPRPGFCYALKETIEIGFDIPGEFVCNTSLLAICVKRTEQIVPAMKIQVTSPYFNQTELQMYDPFSLLSVTATFDRQPNENEIIFIHTPTRYINSSMGFVQLIPRNPRKLGFTYNVTQTSNQANEYIVHIWLPSFISESGESSLRKRRDLSRNNHAWNNMNRNSKRNLKVKTLNDFSLSKLTDLKSVGRHEHNTPHHAKKYKHFTQGRNKNRKDLVELLTQFMKRKHNKKDVGEAHKTERKLEKYFKKKYHGRKRNSHLTRQLKKTTEHEKNIVHYHDRNNENRHHNLLAKNTVIQKSKNTLSNEHTENLREQKHRQHKRTQFNGAEKNNNNVLGVDRPSPGQKNSPGKRQRRGIPNVPDVPDIPGGVGDPLALNVNFGELVWTTGYYSFGVYTINPPSYIETEPLLVRFAEPDWYIYIVTVQMNPDFPVFSKTEGASFNLYEDGAFVELIGEYAGGAMFDRPILTVENVEINPIRYYEAVPERADGQVVKFRAYMSILNSRGVSPILEQSIVPILEDHWKNRLAGDGFLKNTVSVLSTVSCPKTKLDFDGTNITFPSINAGETAFSWERCISESGAFASRECQGGYDDGVRWGPVVFAEGCDTFPTLDTSDSSADLQILSEVVLNETNLNDVLNDTINLTLPNLNLTEADIIYTSEILYNVWQFEDVRANILDDAYEVANNVLERESGIIESAQRITNAANRIIESIDEISSNVDLIGLKNLRVIKSFLATDIVDQDGLGSLIIGLKLDRDDTNNTIDMDDLLNVIQPNDTEASVTDTAIYLDEELLTGRLTRVVFQIYTRTSLFINVNSDRFEVISNVAAARLQIDGQTITELGNNTVTAIFKTTKIDEHSVCAYWDYRANEDAGAWRTDGCNLTVLMDNRISCQCDHLTNFAVLIDLEAYKISDTDKLILEIVTKVGLIVSIVGLGLTILTFILFKHLRSGRGQQVLINLCVSMLCSSLIFLIGMDKTDNKVGCKVVAALLHYFILVSFAWMLVEGILQYLRFVKVLGTYIPNFMLKSMIPAWGIPIIPVVIVAAVDHDLYFGGNGYCWLERDAMLYGFIIPVAAVLLANIIVFCLVLCSLFRRRSKGMKSNQSERKMAFLHFQAAVSIFVILGLTWVFGFLAVDGARVIFHYLFAIFNAFQGFFIFLLFTAREKQIRNAWKKLCYKDSSGKSLSSSSGTDVPRRKTTKSNLTNSTGTSSSISDSDRSVVERKPMEFNNIGYEH